MADLLDSIEGPADVRRLDPPALRSLCEEVRSLIIETVSRTGGHLAANLGVVELTVALLKVFDPPSDKIVWDVSHQGYAYKILTGRRGRFGTLRRMGGLSGFLKRSESEYDVFGAGHSGTALSAALGMAVARDLRGDTGRVIAVLGDAAAGNGISFEAFNNVAGATRQLIVVLNDNEMSISANVGALSRYLGGLLANPRYNRWKRSVEDLAVTRLKMGRLRTAYYRTEEAIKSLFLGSVIFEEFGLRYIGPIDGHNLRSLIDSLTIAREYDRPILLHVTTRKGRGYSFAEKRPEKWHGTAAFDITTGEATEEQDATSYSGVFGQVLARLAREDRRLVAITAAMTSGVGLDAFSRAFPERFFDVGISEEHAVVFAAGMAAQGLVPVFAVYSTFAQRAVDCIIHDVCLQGLPVVLCLDRAGIVGEDGPTHHGVFDLALLRPVPGLTIMQPRDEAELAHMLYTATRLGRPVVLRYPRGAGTGAAVPETLAEIEIGRAETMREGRDVWMWALGDMVPPALEAAGLLEQRGLSAGVVNARFAAPLDTALLSEQARTCELFATLENGVVEGGFGSGVQGRLEEEGFGGRTLRFGWPDEFVPHGSPAELTARYNLTAAAVAAAIAKVAERRESRGRQGGRNHAQRTT